MKNKRENGEVVVEASIIVTLVMVVITIMIYVGMTMYQQTLVSVMANQTASNIAQVYSNNIKDTFTGYVDPDKVYQSITYGEIKTDAYMDVVEQKASVFAKYRLKSSRILAAENTSVEVDIVKKPNELLKSQVVITIRASYDVPLVSMFDTEGLLEFESSGRADCVDILEYINGVEAIGNPEESNIFLLPGSKNCTVTFIPDRNNPSVSTNLIVIKGKTILTSNKYTHCVMPSNPVKDTWDFRGWVDDTGKSFTASTTVNDNLVVYGAWNCTVTLYAEGGQVQSGESYSFKTAVGSRTVFPNASKSGYAFSGWHTEKNGKGIRYLSNDTIINGDVVLYAHWSCTHPSREEYDRTGNVCEGGTIYYRCIQCHEDMGTGSYAGNGHDYVFRCDKKHYFANYFAGDKRGGCGFFHYSNEKNLSYNKYNLPLYHHTNGNPYGYCPVCKYCHQSGGNYYFCGVHANCTVQKPTNGHKR